MCSLLCLIMREFSLDWAMHDMSWVWQTTKRRSEEEWARGEFVHHYITSNSTLSTAINTTPKTTANGSKISTTRLHFSHQRHGGKCVPSPRTANRISIDSPRGAA